MVTVDKNHMSSLLLMEAYAELHEINDRINKYVKKYNRSFQEFESEIEKEEENFEKYDDYIEWKAYHNRKTETEKK